MDIIAILTVRKFARSLFCLRTDIDLQKKTLFLVIIDVEISRYLVF